MTRCRLHVLPPDDEDVPGDADETEENRRRLQEAFERQFTRVDGYRIQDTATEWVSEVFEERPENMERIDEFEEDCLRLYPEANVLRTRQERSVMDDTDHDYDTAILLQVTHALT